MKELRHANIVTLHDIIHTKTSLTFVFEFLSTDLSQVITSIIVSFVINSMFFVHFPFYLYWQ